MHFGMPTLTGLRSLEDCAALCKGLGLQFAELNTHLPEYPMPLHSLRLPNNTGLLHHSS